MIKNGRPGVAFTSNYKNIVRSCIMKVKISSIDNSGGSLEINGLWDTGATHSSINKKHAETLNLPIISMCRVNTAGGIVENATQHLINMELPNKDVIPIQVTATDLVDTDMLIGMDIISQGDFAISNFNGQTIVNFRLPSFSDINFVQMAINTTTHINQNRTGRNAVCPCGSGKKYKNCCGK